jgi:hypothetical protein
VPGRRPSAFITWFQAQQACLNVGKRLPTNAEWQGAVAGTPTDYESGPDDGVHDCNTSTAQHVVLTGSRDRCVSSFGAFDMVGNVFEWTADWPPGNSVPFAHLANTVWLAAILVLFGGCGGGTRTSGSPGPPPQFLTLAGNWQFSTASALSSRVALLLRSNLNLDPLRS